jgi:hypothetical protein
MVVVSPAGNHAIDISGEEVPVEKYTSLLAEIEGLLRS